MVSARPLDAIKEPADLRALPASQLGHVTAQLRAEIIDAVSKTGGHLASSLGAVELITGIHYVFDTPRDRLVLDVGHQGYPHKMLTGRRDAFPTIGKKDGMGKFLRRSESRFDHFGAGHAGTSISAGLGIARALQHRGENANAIVLIGDGSMSAGMAFEAMNHAGDLAQRNLLVVLNDNEMSMSPSVGALSSYLSRTLSAPLARRIREFGKDLLGALSMDARRIAGRAEDAVKSFFTPSMLFEALGFRYVGPIQGNVISDVFEALVNVKSMLEAGEGPVLLHALTAKGFGYPPAQADPDTYHGVTPFDPVTGEMTRAAPAPPSYTKVFARTLTRLAADDERIVAITAAMSGGTGLDAFEREYPGRFYDVGIAEQHAVTFAAGMATEGMKPVAAIYSTFLQRAYDQVVHDVCVQNLDVTFAMDRAGIVGADGATHQGMYDLAYLRTLPNVIVMSPKDENELQHMLRTAIEHPGPAAVRYPRGNGFGVPMDAEIRTLPIGEAELLREGSDVLIFALGTLVTAASQAAAALAERGVSAAVVNARFVKPLDEARLHLLARHCGRVVSVEEHSAMGGFGGAVLESLAGAGIRVPVRCLAVPDVLVEHGNPAAILADLGLDADGIAEAALELIRGGASATTLARSAGGARG